MAAADAQGTSLPSMTPSFNDTSELAFRRMVDSYDLTNVLYNYELYDRTQVLLDWNKRRVLSQNSSIFDCLLTPNPDDPDDAIWHYCIDRPSHPRFGACHNRQVQAFEVTMSDTASVDCLIGWQRRYQSFTDDPAAHYKATSPIGFVIATRTLCYYDREGRQHHTRPLTETICLNATVRCLKNHQTRELEWYVNGAIVVSTSRALDLGESRTGDGIYHIGWSALDDCELIPNVEIDAGSWCRISALELKP